MIGLSQKMNIYYFMWFAIYNIHCLFEYAQAKSTLHHLIESKSAESDKICREINYLERQLEDMKLLV